MIRMELVSTFCCICLTDNNFISLHYIVFVVVVVDVILSPYIFIIYHYCSLSFFPLFKQHFLSFYHWFWCLIPLWIRWFWCWRNRQIMSFRHLLIFSIIFIHSLLSALVRCHCWHLLNFFSSF